MTGVELIAQERRRQMSVEGFDASHDDSHYNDEIAFAAVCYATPPEHRVRLLPRWPWPLNWWKPTPKDRIRELVKAGALIAAEIDRLQRANHK